MLWLYRNWRRRRWRARPFPEGWEAILKERVTFFASLPAEKKPRFRQLLKAFVWEKHWIGAGGLTITDEIQVVVAAAAVRLVLRLDLSYYDRLTEILIYPSTYKHPDKADAAILGEAHDWGTVVLSWDAVKHGLAIANDGHDTATHEFAHVLDRANGTFNGTPNLHAREDYRAWVQVMDHNFHALRARDRRQRRVLRDYGATNEAEFFAVATEAFFEKPQLMKTRTPRLYEELRRFFRQDPAA